MGAFPQPRHGSMPVGGAPRGIGGPGFPGAVIPPLAAALALIVTTAYATAYTLIDLGSIEPADLFLSSAAPSVLASPFAGYDSLADWLDYAPFGGGWAIAIPLLAVAALTAALASRTQLSAGGRLVVGGLACAPLALFTGLLTLLFDRLANDLFYYYDLGEVLLKACGGAAIVGLLGGLLGGLASLAIRPPVAVRVLWPPGARPG